MRGMFFVLAGGVAMVGAWMMLRAYGEAAGGAAGRGGEAGEGRVAVRFVGGYETDPRDRGRPVVLVASALGVPAETFREACKGVHPAPPGRGPTGEEARANKEALLKVLGPVGVTNERLDEVSDYYRYRREAGELWRHVPAEAYARVREGKVVGYVVTKGGAGYSSAPEVHVAGFPDVKAAAVISYGKDLGTNGAVKEIRVGG